MNKKPETNGSLLLARGVTLLELLAVVLILGILSTIATNVYVGTLNRARIAATQNTIREIEVAIARYEIDLGQFPPSGSADVSLSLTLNRTFPEATLGTTIDSTTGGSLPIRNTAVSTSTEDPAASAACKERVPSNAPGPRLATASQVKVWEVPPGEVGIPVHPSLPAAAVAVAVWTLPVLRSLNRNLTARSTGSAWASETVY